LYGRKEEATGLRSPYVRKEDYLSVGEQTPDGRETPEVDADFQAVTAPLQRQIVNNVYLPL